MVAFYPLFSTHTNFLIFPKYLCICLSCKNQWNRHYSQKVSRLCSNPVPCWFRSKRQPLESDWGFAGTMRWSKCFLTWQLMLLSEVGCWSRFWALWWRTVEEWWKAPWCKCLGWLQPAKPPSEVDFHGYGLSGRGNGHASHNWRSRTWLWDLMGKLACRFRRRASLESTLSSCASHSLTRQRKFSRGPDSWLHLRMSRAGIGVWRDNETHDSCLCSVQEWDHLQDVGWRASYTSIARTSAIRQTKFPLFFHFAIFL